MCFCGVSITYDSSCFFFRAGDLVIVACHGFALFFEKIIVNSVDKNFYHNYTEVVLMSLK